MLKFSPANAKTARLALLPAIAKYLQKKRKVYSLDLLAGQTCPGAYDCKSEVVECMGKRYIHDGPHTKFRCFSASTEVVYPATYNLHKHNFSILQGMNYPSIMGEICKAMPNDCGVLRYHVSGDFFSYEYLLAAYHYAIAYPNILFYAYTKSLHHLAKLSQAYRCDSLRTGRILSNFLITASRGGRYDALIPQLKIRTAKVIFDAKQAGRLPIDHDDSHAATPGYSFALLLHGTQPKGTPAATAWQKIKTVVGGYSK